MNIQPVYLRPLDAAADLLARGWSVLPVGPDKRPLCSWAALQKARATEADVADWRAKWPDAGIGILAGEISGLLIVDLDAKDAAKFAEAKERVGACLPESLVCPMARTRSGGEHWYFRRPAAGMGNRAHVAGLPLDVRCDGGYVVAPPTPGYSWIVSPLDAELPEPPEALLQLLAKPRPAPAPDPERASRAPGFDYNVERARRYVARMPHAVSGQDGHGATLRVASVLVWAFALDDCDAWEILNEYSLRCDPPWTERELRHKLESARQLTDHQHPYGYLRDAAPARAGRAPEPSGEYEVDANGAPVEKDGPPPSDGHAARPRIIVDTNEQRVVKESISALARQRRYFQRGSTLYRIVQPASPDGEARPLPVLDVVPAASLEVAMSASADWCRLVAGAEDEDGPAEKAIRPPSWAVKAVLTAAQWHGVPSLVGITSTPCIRRDGTILNTPGYDPSTGLVYRPIGAVNPIKDRPTYEDALRARDELFEVVEDYPFGGPEHRAAWLSLLLTPFARYSLYDSAPLGYFDANTRGSGKSLLAAVTALIATGRQVPMSSWPDEEDEREKRITTFVMEGTPVVVFDNCENTIGGQTTNAILTSGLWKGRILGRTASTGELPLRTTFFATGNNCDFSADTPRRTIHVRIVSPLERPEQRTGFRHPHLLEWAAENRPRLAAAALTILRAYQVAGAPPLNLQAMGGFTDWSRFVRSPVVWVGCPDPVLTQDLLMATADRSTAELAALLDGVKEAQLGTTEWFTPQQLLAIATLPTGERLRDALLEHAPDKRGQLPSPRVLGILLRRHVDRVHGGLALRQRPGSQVRWRVIEVDQ